MPTNRVADRLLTVPVFIVADGAFARLVTTSRGEAAGYMNARRPSAPSLAIIETEAVVTLPVGLSPLRSG